MAKRRFQPYPFDTLRSYSRLESTLQNAILGTVASGPWPELWRGALASFQATSEKYLGESLRIAYCGLWRALEPLCQSEAGSGKAEERGRVAACFFVPAIQGRIYASFPVMWVRQTVLRLLGKGGESSVQALPLSPMEEGVFEFFLLKVLQAQKMSAQKLSEGTPWQYEGLLSQSDFAAFLASPHPGFISISGRIEGPGTAVPVTVYMDGESLVARAELERAACDDDYRRHLALSGHVVLPIRAEAGRVLLSATDRARLEEGDILLFDEAYVDVVGESLAGRPKLRVEGFEHWVFGSDIALCGPHPRHKERRVYGLKVEAFREEK